MYSLWRKLVSSEHCSSSLWWTSMVYKRRIHYLKQKKSLQYFPVAEMLDMDKNELKKTIIKYQMHKSEYMDDILINVKLLLDWGISKSHINDYIHLLCLPHLVLKNRLQICRECGCLPDKIGPVILNISQFFSIQIRLLKAYEVFPDEHDVFKHILERVDILESESLVRPDNLDSVKDIYKYIYTFYLHKQVPHVMKPDPIEIKVNKYIPSVQNFVKNVDLMKNTFKFNAEEFRKNQHLMAADPDNVVSLIKGVQGLNIAELAPKYPELLHVLPKKIQKVYNITKEHNVDFTLFLRNPVVFSMNSTDFEYRLTSCLNSKFLRVFKNHSKLPQLIAKSRIANERLQILTAFKMKCYNLNILVGSTNQFLKHVTDGIDEVNCNDTFVYVSCELNKPFEQVKLQLMKNPFVKYIPVVTVKENLDYLRQLGFDNDDIFNCVQILLYPKNTVERKVMQIHTGEFFIRKLDEVLSISKRFYLPLSLYYIEKEHNFSNSALWQKHDSGDQETVEIRETDKLSG